MNFYSKSKKIIGFFTLQFFFWQMAFAYSMPVLALVPKSIGQVQSSPNPAPKSAFLILNAHTSSDAQKNISELLTFFQSQGIDLIGLEGADQKIDGKLFRDFPFKDSLARAAWQMVKEGKFTGAEYFYITSEKLPSFFGLEDKDLYLNNRDAFIQTNRTAKTLADTIENLNRSVSSLKKRIYSKKLLSFDQAIERYEQNSVDYIDHVGLVTAAAKKADINIPEFPNLYALSKAIEKEKKISQKKLRKDLEQIKVDLSQKALDDSIFGLIVGENVTAHSAGDIFEQYQKIHAYFSTLINQKQFDPKSYKSFYSYWEWLSLFMSLDSFKMFDELNDLTQLTFERLSRSKKERKLIELSQSFKRFRQMISIQLTQEEWERVRVSNSLWFQELISFIRSEIKSFRMTELETNSIREVELSAQRFYELAEKRNQVFADRIEQEMNHKKKDISVIVLGGFHEKGLKTALEAKGIATSVISPKINEALTDIPYFDRMIGKPTRLESMLIQASTLEAALKISGILSKSDRILANQELKVLAAIAELQKTVEREEGESLISQINRALKNENISIKKAADKDGNFSVLIGTKDKSILLAVEKASLQVTDAELETLPVANAAQAKIPLLETNASNLTDVNSWIYFLRRPLNSFVFAGVPGFVADTFVFRIGMPSTKTSEDIFSDHNLDLSRSEARAADIAEVFKEAPHAEVLTKLQFEELTTAKEDRDAIILGFNSEHMNDFPDLLTTELFADLPQLGSGKNPVVVLQGYVGVPGFQFKNEIARENFEQIMSRSGFMMQGMLQGLHQEIEDEDVLDYVYADPQMLKIIDLLEKIKSGKKARSSALIEVIEKLVLPFETKVRDRVKNSLLEILFPPKQSEAYIVFDYTSNYGRQEFLEVLIEAMKVAQQKTATRKGINNYVLFTRLEEKVKYKGEPIHAQLLAYLRELRAKSEINFFDFQNPSKPDFPVENPSKVYVVNLPPSDSEPFDTLQDLSDFAVVAGDNGARHAFTLPKKDVGPTYILYPHLIAQTELNYQITQRLGKLERLPDIAKVRSIVQGAFQLQNPYSRPNRLFKQKRIEEFAALMVDRKFADNYRNVFRHLVSGEINLFNYLVNLFKVIESGEMPIWEIQRHPLDSRIIPDDRLEITKATKKTALRFNRHFLLPVFMNFSIGHGDPTFYRHILEVAHIAGANVKDDVTVLLADEKPKDLVEALIKYERVARGSPVDLNHLRFVLIERDNEGRPVFRFFRRKADAQPVSDIVENLLPPDEGKGRSEIRQRVQKWVDFVDTVDQLWQTGTIQEIEIPGGLVIHVTTGSVTVGRADLLFKINPLDFNQNPGTRLQELLRGDIFQHLDPDLHPPFEVRLQNNILQITRTRRAEMRADEKWYDPLFALYVSILWRPSWSVTEKAIKKFNREDQQRLWPAVYRLLENITYIDRSIILSSGIPVLLNQSDNAEFFLHNSYLLDLLARQVFIYETNSRKKISAKEFAELTHQILELARQAPEEEFLSNVEIVRDPQGKLRLEPIYDSGMTQILTPFFDDGLEDWEQNGRAEVRAQKIIGALKGSYFIKMNPGYEAHLIDFEGKEVVDRLKDAYGAIDAIVSPKSSLVIFKFRNTPSKIFNLERQKWVPISPNYDTEVLISPDDQWILYRSTALILADADGKPVESFNPHQLIRMRAKFSMDGKHLLVFYDQDQNTDQIYDLKTLRYLDSRRSEVRSGISESVFSVEDTDRPRKGPKQPEQFQAPHKPFRQSSLFETVSSGITNQPNNNMPTRIRPMASLGRLPKRMKKSEVIEAGTSIVNILRNVWPSAFRLFIPNKDFIAVTGFDKNIINNLLFVNQFLILGLAFIEVARVEVRENQQSAISHQSADELIAEDFERRAEVRMKEDNLNLRSFFEGEVGIDTTQLSKRDSLTGANDFNPKKFSVFGNIDNNAFLYLNRLFGFAWLKLEVKRVRDRIEFNLHRLFSLSEPIGGDENNILTFPFVNNIRNSSMKALLSQISFTKAWLGSIGVGYGIFNLLGRQFSLENSLFNVFGIAKLHREDDNLENLPVNRFLSGRAEVRTGPEVKVLETVFDLKKRLWATALEKDGNLLLIRMNETTWHYGGSLNQRVIDVKRPMYDFLLNEDPHGYLGYLTLRLDDEGKVVGGAIDLKERRDPQNKWRPLLEAWIAALQGHVLDRNHPFLAQFPMRTRIGAEEPIPAEATPIYRPSRAEVRPEKLPLAISGRSESPEVAKRLFRAEVREKERIADSAEEIGKLSAKRYPLSPKFRRAETRGGPIFMHSPGKLAFVWDISFEKFSPEAVLRMLHSLPRTTEKEIDSMDKRDQLVFPIELGHGLKKIDWSVIQDFTGKARPVISMSRWGYQLTPEKIIVFDSKGNQIADSHDPDLRFFLEVQIYEFLKSVTLASRQENKFLTQPYIKKLISQLLAQSTMGFYEDRIEWSGEMFKYVLNRETGEINAQFLGQVGSTGRESRKRIASLYMAFATAHSLHELEIDGRKEDPVLALPLKAAVMQDKRNLAAVSRPPADFQSLVNDLVRQLDLRSRKGQISPDTLIPLIVSELQKIKDLKIEDVRYTLRKALSLHGINYGNAVQSINRRGADKLNFILGQIVLAKKETSRRAEVRSGENSEHSQEFRPLEFNILNKSLGRAYTDNYVFEMNELGVDVHIINRLLTLAQNPLWEGHAPFRKSKSTFAGVVSAFRDGKAPAEPVAIVFGDKKKLRIISFIEGAEGVLPEILMQAVLEKEIDVNLNIATDVAQMRVHPSVVRDEENDRFFLRIEPRRAEVRIQTVADLQQRLKDITKDKANRDSFNEIVKSLLRDTEAKLSLARTYVDSLDLSTELRNYIVDQILGTSEKNRKTRELLASLILLLHQNYDLSLEKISPTAIKDAKLYLITGLHVNASHAQKMFSEVSKYLPPITPETLSPVVVFHLEDIHPDDLYQFLQVPNVSSVEDQKQITRFYSSGREKLRKRARDDARDLQNGKMPENSPYASTPFGRQVFQEILKVRQRGYQVRVFFEDPEADTWWNWNTSERLGKELGQPFLEGKEDVVLTNGRRLVKLRYAADHARDFEEEGPKVSQRINSDYPRATHFVLRGSIHNVLAEAVEIPEERKHVIHVLPESENPDLFLEPINKRNRLEKQGALTQELEDKLILQDTLINILGTPLHKTGMDHLEMIPLLNKVFSQLETEDILRLIRSFAGPTNPRLLDRLFEVYYRIKANFPQIFAGNENAVEMIERVITEQNGGPYVPVSTAIPTRAEVRNAVGQMISNPNAFGALIGIVQSQSTGQGRLKSPRSLRGQTFHFPPFQSANTSPVIRSPIVTIIKRTLRGIEGILPRTPPIAPAIISAWNRVNEVLDNASSLLGVQKKPTINIYLIVKFYISQYKIKFSSFLVSGPTAFGLAVPMNVNGESSIINLEKSAAIYEPRTTNDETGRAEVRSVGAPNEFLIRAREQLERIGSDFNEEEEHLWMALVEYLNLPYSLGTSELDALLEQPARFPFLWKRYDDPEELEFVLSPAFFESGEEEAKLEEPSYRSKLISEKADALLLPISREMWRLENILRLTLTTNQLRRDLKGELSRRLEDWLSEPLSIGHIGTPDYWKMFISLLQFKLTDAILAIYPHYGDIGYDEDFKKEQWKKFEKTFEDLSKLQEKRQRELYDSSLRMRIEYLKSILGVAHPIIVESFERVYGRHLNRKFPRAEVRKEINLDMHFSIDPQWIYLHVGTRRFAVPRQNVMQLGTNWLGQPKIFDMTEEGPVGKALDPEVLGFIHMAFKVLFRYYAFSQGARPTDMGKTFAITSRILANPEVLSGVSLPLKVTYEGNRIITNSDPIGEFVMDLNQGSGIYNSRKLQAEQSFYVNWSELGYYLPVMIHEEALTAFREQMKRAPSSIPNLLVALRKSYDAIRAEVRMKLDYKQKKELKEALTSAVSEVTNKLFHSVDGAVPFFYPSEEIVVTYVTKQVEKKGEKKIEKKSVVEMHTPDMNFRADRNYPIITEILTAPDVNISSIKVKFSEKVNLEAEKDRLIDFLYKLIVFHSYGHTGMDLYGYLQNSLKRYEHIRTAAPFDYSFILKGRAEVRTSLNQEEVLKAKTLLSHLANRSDRIPENHTLVVLGNPVPEYPVLAVQVARELKSPHIIIVGKGNQAVPEWQRIRAEMIAIDPSLEGKILVDEHDDSMHTGMNVTTAVKIFKEHQALPNDVVIAQMPTGTRVSERIFEFQWNQKAAEQGLGARPPTFYAYAPLPPVNLQENTPLSGSTLFYLIHSLGQIDRLKNWPKQELIASHLEDLPKEVLEAERSIRNFFVTFIQSKYQSVSDRFFSTEWEISVSAEKLYESVKRLEKEPSTENIQKALKLIEQIEQQFSEPGDYVYSQGGLQKVSRYRAEARDNIETIADALLAINATEQELRDFKQHYFGKEVRNPSKESREFAIREVFLSKTGIPNDIHEKNELRETFNRVEVMANEKIQFARLLPIFQNLVNVKIKDDEIHGKRLELGITSDFEIINNGHHLVVAERFPHGASRVSIFKDQILIQKLLRTFDSIARRSEMRSIPPAMGLAILEAETEVKRVLKKPDLLKKYGFNETNFVLYHFRDLLLSLQQEGFFKGAFSFRFLNHLMSSSEPEFKFFASQILKDKKISYRKVIVRLLELNQKYQPFVKTVNENIDRHPEILGRGKLSGVRFYVGSTSPEMPMTLGNNSSLALNLEHLWNKGTDIFGLGSVALMAGHNLLPYIKLTSALPQSVKNVEDLAANWAALQISSPEAMSDYLHQVTFAQLLISGNINPNTAARLLAFSREGRINLSVQFARALGESTTDDLVADYTKVYRDLTWQSAPQEPQAGSDGRHEVRMIGQSLNPDKVKEYLLLLWDVELPAVIQLLQIEGYGFTAERFRNFASFKEAVESTDDYFANIPTLLYGAVKIKLRNLGLDNTFEVQRPMPANFMRTGEFAAKFDEWVIKPLRLALQTRDQKTSPQSAKQSKTNEALRVALAKLEQLEPQDYRILQVLNELMRIQMQIAPINSATLIDQRQAAYNREISKVISDLKTSATPEYIAAAEELTNNYSYTHDGPEKLFADVLRHILQITGRPEEAIQLVLLDGIRQDRFEPDTKGRRVQEGNVIRVKFKPLSFSRAEVRSEVLSELQRLLHKIPGAFMTAVAEGELINVQQVTYYTETRNIFDVALEVSTVPNKPLDIKRELKQIQIGLVDLSTQKIIQVQMFKLTPDGQKMAVSFKGLTRQGMYKLLTVKPERKMPPAKKPSASEVIKSVPDIRNVIERVVDKLESLEVEHEKYGSGTISDLVSVDYEVADVESAFQRANVVVEFDEEMIEFSFPRATQELIVKNQEIELSEFINNLINRSETRKVETGTIPAHLLPNRSEAQVQTFVDLIQAQRESKTIYLRLSESEIDSLNDITRSEVREFLGTLAGLTSLNHRVIVAVPSEEAERDFNKRFDSFRLNERIKVPAQAILTAQHFDQEGASLVQAIGKQRVSQVYFLTEISEAASLASNVTDQTKLIVTDRVIDGGFNAVRTNLLQKARLAVEAALLRRDAFQVTGAQNNILIPNRSVFENLISSLTNFRQATLHILTQA